MSGRIIVTPYNPQTLLDKNIAINSSLITGFNLGPHQFINIVISDKDENYALESAFWGFCPTWLEPKDFCNANFSIPLENTKPCDYTCIAKTIKFNGKKKQLIHMQKPCIVPVTGFFKWKDLSPSITDAKTPSPILKKNTAVFAIRKNLNQVFFLAGIWTAYINAIDLTSQKTFALVNAPSPKGLEVISARMPIILDKSQALKWLATNNLTTFSVPNNPMEFYRVKSKVGDKSNVDKSVILPISPRFSTLNTQIDDT